MSSIDCVAGLRGLEGVRHLDRRDARELAGVVEIRHRPGRGGVAGWLRLRIGPGLVPFGATAHRTSVARCIRTPWCRPRRSLRRRPRSLGPKRSV